jgi:hypothetical protein
MTKVRPSIDILHRGVVLCWLPEYQCPWFQSWGFHFLQHVDLNRTIVADQEAICIAAVSEPATRAHLSIDAATATTANSNVNQDQTVTIDDGPPHAVYGNKKEGGEVTMLQWSVICNIHPVMQSHLCVCILWVKIGL